MSSIEHESIVLKGNINLNPSKFSDHISKYIFDEAIKKYTGKMKEIKENEYAIIIRVKNIKQNSIESISNRNSNKSSMRIYFNMVVSLFYPKMDTIIDCTVTSINDEYFEGNINSTNKVIILIFLDESNINNDNFELNDDGVKDFNSNKIITVGTSIKCTVTTIMPDQTDLIIFARLENVIN